VLIHIWTITSISLLQITWHSDHWVIMNEMMQYWYCYVTIILKLEEFKSSRDIIQEGVFCCI